MSEVPDSLPDGTSLRGCSHTALVRELQRRAELTKSAVLVVHTNMHGSLADRYAIAYAGPATQILGLAVAAQRNLERDLLGEVRDFEED